jgi:hypothetical protein
MKNFGAASISSAEDFLIDLPAWLGNCRPAVPKSWVFQLVAHFHHPQLCFSRSDLSVFRHSPPRQCVVFGELLQSSGLQGHCERVGFRADGFVFGAILDP